MKKLISIFLLLSLIIVLIFPVFTQEETLKNTEPPLQTSEDADTKDDKTQIKSSSESIQHPQTGSESAASSQSSTGVLQDKKTETPLQSEKTVSPASEKQEQNPDDDIIPSLEFIDANIQDVIQILATFKNFNFVIGDDVNGTISIKLEKVPFYTALESIITSKGYCYRIKDNLLRIDTPQKFAEEDSIKQKVSEQEQLVTVVFELKYINGNDILELLKTQLSSRGKIIPLKATIPGRYTATASAQGTNTNITMATRSASTVQESINKLIVIDIVGTLTKIKKLIDELDTMPIQILIESKMLETQADAQLDLGIRWEFLGGGDDGTGGLSIGGTDISKIFSNQKVKENEIIDEDTDTRSVSLLTADEANALGYDKVTWSSPVYIKKNFLTLPADKIWDNTNATGYQTDADTGITTSSAIDPMAKSLRIGKTITGTNTTTKTIDNLATATLTASDFNIVLNALKSNGDLNIVSNPSILTINNHEAGILVGERYPIFKAAVSDTGTVTQSFDRYEPIGVQLQVLPRVIFGNYIDMIVRPSVTSLGSLVSAQSLQMNRINTREASTELIVKSGDTIVIGGLLSERSNEEKDGIPFLCKIPLIGKLFSHKHKQSSKTNLTVFVTPTILNDENADKFKEIQLNNQKKNGI